MKILGIFFILVFFAQSCFAAVDLISASDDDEEVVTLPQSSLFKIKAEQNKQIPNLSVHTNKISNEFEGISKTDNVIPFTPMQYSYRARIEKENNFLYSQNIYNHSEMLYGQKFIPQIYSLPPRAKVLYSKKGLHPNAYTQAVSMLANSLVFNQEMDNIIFDKEISLADSEKEKFTDNNRLWFKPINSIEGNLINSSVYVSNNFYGGAVGADTDFYKTKKNSYYKFGSYGAVLDSNSGYRGIDLYSNGILAGVYASRFKNKSFAVINAKVNYNNHLSSGQYGIDDYQSIMSGVSLKTGSNIPLLKEKVCVQHYHVYSYTYGHGYDYENAAQMHVNGTDLNNFWTTHGMKIFANNESSLKPYLNIGMAINLFGGDIKQKINNNKVESLKLDNYFICSAGVQKEIKDRFLGFWEVSAKATGRIYMNTYFGLKWKI